MAVNMEFIGESTRVYIGEYYDVEKYKDNCSMRILHDGRSEPTTLEQIVNEIRSNCIEAKERGYERDEKWLITKTQYTNIYDENGAFYQSSQTKRVIALYDNGEIIMY